MTQPSSLSRHLILVLAITGFLGCKANEAPKPTAEDTAQKEAEATKAAIEQKVAEAAKAAPAAPPQIPAPPDVAAAPEDAEVTESGLASKVLTPGTGTEKPSKWDSVSVHYTGWTTDGKMFDSSVARGQPTTFPLNRVIPGWTEGVQLMVQGEKRRFWIPGKLAYGEKPAGAPPAGFGPPLGMLVFDVELISIEKGPEPPPTPEDVADVPKNAKKTKSGLASRVLTKGKGKKHPKADNMVSVHYSGWTTDGELFDSSVMRGRPAQFALNRVIPGWTEGVQLMVEGEKRRFWIPGKLAYGEKPPEGAARRGPPLGMLVFDVELLQIMPAPPAGRPRMP